MLSCAAEQPELLAGDFTEWVEGGEIEIGRAVLNKLQVPETVATAIEAFWDGYLAMPPVTLADTLLLAEMLSPIPSPLHHLKNEEMSNMTTAEIEMIIGEETLSTILSESAEEIDSLTKALRF